jgi:hypothetical protein
VIRVNKYIRELSSFDLTKGFIAVVFFIFLFIYFFLFNRYHFAFQEQLQLFRFSTDYLKEFLSYPGGLLDYSGAFFTQFFVSPVAAASIITMAGVIVFLLTGKIFSFSGHNNDTLAYIPVLMIAALHSSHLYSFANTIGLIITLAFSVICMKAGSKGGILLLIFTWPLLYISAGGFAFLGGILLLVYLLVYSKNNLPQAVILAVLCLLTPLLTGQTIYFVENSRLWTGSLPLHTGTPFTETFFVLCGYFPVALLLTKISIRKSAAVNPVKRLLWLSIVNILAIVISVPVLFSFFYDRETELLLGLDHHVQKSEWQKVLEVSARISDPNRMVLHYTNLALHKTGEMGDRLFHYPQSGKQGLWLDWQQDWLAAFFGCGTCFDLGYNSEAYRLAYEAMVARGPNPRSLKILALSSIVDDNTDLASKYLAILHQSLFYRSWSDKYIDMADNPEMIPTDAGIMHKKDLIIKTDFINPVNPGGRLTHLLREHPENRMAFEYQMASFLLEKDLDGFVAGMEGFSKFGYKNLPLHYQEALAAYKSYSGKDAVPPGYTLSRKVTDRLAKYAKTVYSYGPGNTKAAEKMYNEFGNTYWYYLKFIDSEKPLF